MTDHDSILDQDISILCLSKRSMNALQFTHSHHRTPDPDDPDVIITVGDLITYTDEDLLDRRNFGQKSLDEVVYALNQFGLRLAPSFALGSRATPEQWAAAIQGLSQEQVAQAFRVAMQLSFQTGRDRVVTAHKKQVELMKKITNHARYVHYEISNFWNLANEEQENAR